MATIYETGNHISQNGDGNQRRKCAKEFVSQVQKALDGESPFKTIRFLNADRLRNWIQKFTDEAMRGVGFCDLSIIHDWEWMCKQNREKTVYIWSKDGHLMEYCRESLF